MWRPLRRVPGSRPPNAVHAHDTASPRTPSASTPSQKPEPPLARRATPPSPASRALELRDRTLQPGPRGRERLGEHARARDHRHEVRVALPTWHEVQVEVPREACARDATHVEPVVDAVRLVLHL